MTLDAIISQYRDVEGGLIEALHAIDNEYRCIPESALSKLAEAFDVPVAKVYGVATFYAKFKVGERGSNLIRVCESAPCHNAGAALVLAAIESNLGIKAGETTADGRFTLELTECVGCCNESPTITINEVPYTKLTPEKVPELLSKFR